jgi:hypothetical protein
LHRAAGGATTTFVPPLFASTVATFARATAHVVSRSTRLLECSSELHDHTPSMT